MTTMFDVYTKEINDVKTRINMDINTHIKVYHPRLDMFERHDLVEYLDNKQLEMIMEILRIVDEFMEEVKTSQNTSVTP